MVAGLFYDLLGTTGASRADNFSSFKRNPNTEVMAERVNYQSKDLFATDAEGLKLKQPLFIGGNLYNTGDVFNDDSFAFFQTPEAYRYVVDPEPTGAVLEGWEKI